MSETRSTDDRTLVERLRNCREGEWTPLLNEAANEIERLQRIEKYGEPVMMKPCGCAVSMDELTTYLCERHSGG